jgi:hypothetical protein
MWTYFLDPYQVFSLTVACMSLLLLAPGVSFRPAGPFAFFQIFFQQKGTEKICDDGPPTGVGPWALPMVA